MNEITAPTTDRLAEIRQREAAASPGPWSWRGNVDNGDPYLSYRKPGWGRVEVLRHYERERTADDKGAKDYDEFLRDTRVHDASLNDGKGGYRPYTDEERAERIREDWLEDQWEQPRTDTRMAFVHREHMWAVDARELAIFEVCPDATTREDPRVYRGDVVGIRHPDAEFIANARQDVTDLLAIIDQLTTRTEWGVKFDAPGNGYPGEERIEAFESEDAAVECGEGRTRVVIVSRQVTEWVEAGA